MGAEGSQNAILRVSTRDLPEPERTPYWREVFARQMCHLEFEPLSDGPLDVDATMLALPGLSVGWCHSTTPARWSRTPELVKDGDDAFALIVPLAGAVMRSQRGQDLEANPGDGAGILHSDPGSIQFGELDEIAVMVPRAALSPLVSDLEGSSTHLVPRTNDALRLLRLYLTAWRQNFDIADPALCRLVATHVHDLIAMALGATRDGAEIAKARGLRAARLRAIKADILERLGSPGLSETAVALRQGITPRYIRMLFEAEGTSFSKFVLEQRLLLAHRLLMSPLHAGSTIGAIAFTAGFGDLSYFNRCFRRRFGATPSELRGGNGQP